MRRIGRRGLVIGAVALSLLLVGGALWVWLSRGPVPETPARRLSSPIGSLSCLIRGQQPDQLIAGGPAGDVVVWESARSRPQVLKKLSQAPITTLAMSSTGFLSAGTADSAVVGWQVTGNDNKTLSVPKFPAPVAASAVHPSRFEVAVGLADGSLYLFAENEKPRRIRSRHAGGAKRVCFHPGGDYFVTGGTDGRLIWRNADSLRVQAAIRPHSNEVSALAFSDDGELLASGDYDGRIIVRNAKTTERTSQWRQPDAVSGMAFVGSSLLTGSWDGWLRLWSSESDVPVAEIYTGQPIYGITLVDPAGTTVATVHNTNEVLFWNLPGA